MCAADARPATDDGDDRDRPLMLAIRSTRLLGLASVGYGIFFVFAYGYFNRYERYRPHFMLMGMALWVVPGVFFLVNSYRLEQRSRAAALWSIVFAVFQGLCALGLFALQFALTPTSPIPLVLSFLWVIAMAQLSLHLKRSVPLLSIDAEKRHGFDVAVTQRVVPLENEGSNGGNGCHLIESERGK